MHFVLDNSVVMRWLFADGSQEAIDYSARILDLLQHEDNAAAVPCVWALEVGNVIVRAEAKGVLQEARSAEFLGILQDMSIETDPRSTTHALGDTIQLARRYGLSTYDASYLELALREGLPLATNDQALRKALAVAGGKLA
ncbi:MAG: type II toxin-antitoxin system VapC family toxin [Propionivibrio sp.]